MKNDDTLTLIRRKPDGSIAALEKMVTRETATSRPAYDRAENASNVRQENLADRRILFAPSFKVDGVRRSPEILKFRPEK